MSNNSRWGSLRKDSGKAFNPRLLKLSQGGNERGALAMAKIGDPRCAEGSPEAHLCVPRPDWVTTFLPREEFVNSATNQWFVNVADNRRSLDNQNGGFTVFARVLGDGMDLVDDLIALQHLPNAAYTLAAEPMRLLEVLGTLPVHALPAEPPTGFGCFQVDELVALFTEPEPPNIGDPIPDPAEPHNLSVLSGDCGTLLADPGDFVPNPSQSQACTDPDAFGWGVFDDGGQLFFRTVQGEMLPYTFTCEEVLESKAQLTSRRTTMMAATAPEFVYVEEAIVLPESRAAMRLAAALVTLWALAWKLRKSGR